MPSIVPVVEGDGETTAFPLLLRRLLHEKRQRFDLDAGQAVNARGRSKLLNDFEKFLSYAQSKPRCGAVLVLLDSDDDCPIDLARGLSSRCRQAGVTKPVAIVCAQREYEAWFLASLETIRGSREIPPSAVFPGDAEALSDVKGWITRQLPPGRAYKETLDQASLTSLIDFDLAHGASRSFRRLCRAVEQLVEAMGSSEVIVTP